MSETAPEPFRNLLWIDMETDGLNPWDGKEALEIGLMMTDLELDNLDSVHWVLKPEGWDRSRCDDFITDMHTKNGLLDDIDKYGISYAEAEHEIMDTLNLWGVPLNRSVPLCGSSLRLDRNFLDFHFPILAKALSYRSIDVSSLKELMRRYRPEKQAEYEATYTDDDKGHRVLDDMEWSARELGFYLKELGLL